MVLYRLRRSCDWAGVHVQPSSSRERETRARVKITSREKITPRRVSPFLAWGDFHVRSRFARSTIPEEK